MPVKRKSLYRNLPTKLAFFIAMNVDIDLAMLKKENTIVFENSDPLLFLFNAGTILQTSQLEKDFQIHGLEELITNDSKTMKFVSAENASLEVTDNKFNLEAPDNKFVLNQDNAIKNFLLQYNPVPPEPDIDTLSSQLSELVINQDNLYELVYSANVREGDKHIGNNPLLIPETKKFDFFPESSSAFSSSGTKSALVAVDDVFAIDEDTVLTTGNVLFANPTLADFDPENGLITVIPPFQTMSTLGAVIVMNADGTFTYDPTNSLALQGLQLAGLGGISVIDTFNYVIEDDMGDRDAATVSITVLGRNDAPVLMAQTLTTNESLDPNLLDVDSGDSVGFAAGMDVDVIETLTHTFGEQDADGRYSLNPATGEVTVGNDTLIDYEDGARHVLSVTVTDSGGLFATQVIEIRLTDLGNDTDPNEEVLGTNGANLIVTGDGNDYIRGLAGRDDINSGEGHDVIQSGGSANTILNGGPGFDTILGTNLADTLWITPGFANITNIEEINLGLSTNTLTASAVGTYDLNTFAPTFVGGGDLRIQTNAASTIIGTNDRDYIMPAGGVDLVLAGGGDDYIDTFGNGITAGDVIDGGPGTDTIIGGEIGNDIIYIADGSYSNLISIENIMLLRGLSTITANVADTYDLNDFLATFNFSGTDLQLVTSSGADTLIGTPGNDYLNSSHGADTIIAGEGDDIIRIGGISGVDTIDGGGGIDILRGHDSVLDILWVTSNLSNITNVENIEFSYFGYDAIQLEAAGTIDLQSDYYDSFTIVREAEDLRLNGSSAVDTLLGSSLDDFIEGRGGADTIDARAGDDFISMASNNAIDVIDGGSGIDTIYGTFGNDNLYVADGFNNITNVEDIDFLRGTNQIIAQTTGTYDLSLLKTNFNVSGTDIRLIGSAFGDSIIGSAVGEYLDGRAGDDTMTGGGGNDLIIGGLGSDTVAFSGNAADYSFFQNSTLNTDVNIRDDRLGSPDGSDIVRDFDFFSFADGVIAVAALGGSLTLDPSLSTDTDAGIDNTFTGTNFGETINGTPARDTINSLNGNDTLNGGDGNDRLDAGRNVNTLNAEAGDDILEFNNRGNNMYDGGPGNDTLLGDESLEDTLFVFPNFTNISNIENINFGFGNAIVAGLAAGTYDLATDFFGAFNITLGNDVGVIAPTAAQNFQFLGSTLADTIIGTSGDDYIDPNRGLDNTSTGAGDDTIVFTLMSSGEVFDGGPGTDTLIGINETSTDVLRITDDTYSNLIDIENIEFGLGFNQVLPSSPGTYDLGNFRATFNVSGTDIQWHGTSGVDTLIGTNGDDILAGRGGTDTINALDGDDLISLVAQNSIVIIDGGAGIDTIFGTDNTNNLYVSDGFSNIINIENIDFGTGTNSILTDAAGGGTYDLEIFLATWNVSTGEDLRLVGGNGVDTLLGTSGNDYLDGGLFGGDTIDARAGDDIIAIPSFSPNTINGGPGIDTLQGDLRTTDNDGLGVTSNFANIVGIENIDFGLGSNQILGRTAGGTYDLNTFYASFNVTGVDIQLTADGTMIGTPGPDYLNGSGTNVIINAGAGDDIITPGRFDDIVNAGDGDDIINIESAVGSGLDTIDGGPGYDIIMGTEPVIIPSVSDNVLSVLSNFSNWTNIEEIRLLHGHDIIQGTGAGDTLNLSTTTFNVSGLDELQGLGGDDALTGDYGENILRGGLGSDTLTGGDGTDTFLWGAGDATGAPTDIVTDFIIGSTPTLNNDTLDFTNLLTGENAGNIDDYLSFSLVGSDTHIDVDIEGNGSNEQDIILLGVDLTALGATDLDIINSLVATNQIQFDS